MESIDPAHSSTRQYNPTQSHHSNSRASGEVQGIEKLAKGEQATTESAYAGLFDDGALERLQKNLQSVSEMATQALERLKREA